MWDCLYCRRGVSDGKLLWHGACRDEWRRRIGHGLCTICGLERTAGVWCGACMSAPRPVAFRNYPGDCGAGRDGSAT